MVDKEGFDKDKPEDDQQSPKTDTEKGPENKVCHVHGNKPHEIPSALPVRVGSRSFSRQTPKQGASLKHRVNGRVRECEGGEQINHHLPNSEDGKSIECSQLLLQFILRRFCH